MPSAAIVYFLHRHWRQYAALVGLGLFVGMLEAASLVAFIPVMNVLVGTPDTSAGPGAMLSSLTGAIALTGGDPFLSACVVFLVLTLVKGVMALVYEYRVSRASGAVLHQYRQELLERLRLLPLSYFADSRAGDITYSLGLPPYMMAKLLYALPRAAIDLFRLLSVVLVLFVVEPRVTIALAVLVAGLYLVLVRGMSRYSYRQATQRRDAEQGMSGLATEWVHGIRSIRIAHADGHWLAGYSRFSHAAKSAHARLSLLLAAPRHVFELLAFTMFAGSVAAVYAYSPSAFREHIAVIGIFAVGLVRVLPSVAALARLPLEVRSVLPDVEQLYRMLNEKPVHSVAVRRPYQRIESNLRIAGVTVEFEGRGNVLQDIDLEVKKGSVVAIVGPSGSGKSTLLNLLIGVVAAKSGSVQIDGRDIDVIDRATFLSRIGYVGQDVLLFKGTIRENIAFFRPDVSEPDLREAATTAEIADFIESLPGGYDAPVGEGGVNLSGGQAQRIAIARAIVHDPDMLLLDEATSALDSASEGAVVHALEQAAKNRTVVMVTHRLRSARWAEMVVVLENGRIVARGRWEDLLADPQSVFSEMCREQHLFAAATAGPARNM